MNIDKRLDEARGHRWEASKTAFWAAFLEASEPVFWAAFLEASEAASWTSRYKDCSYEVQIEILKGLLDEHR
jgi:hypothetical protein